MKIAFTILLLLPFYTFAQTSKANETNSLSNAEKFNQKSGALIQRTYSKLGQLKECDVQVASFADLITGQKSNAVRFDYKNGGSHLALLDADEVDGLIKSIKIIQQKVVTTTPVDYTEVGFTSRSGFEMGCYYNVAKTQWTTYLKLEKYDDKSYLFMTVEDLGQFLTLLEKAKPKLI